MVLELILLGPWFLWRLLRGTLIVNLIVRLINKVWLVVLITPILKKWPIKVFLWYDFTHLTNFWLQIRIRIRIIHFKIWLRRIIITFPTWITKNGLHAPKPLLRVLNQRNGWIVPDLIASIGIFALSIRPVFNGYLFIRFYCYQLCLLPCNYGILNTF